MYESVGSARIESSERVAFDQASLGKVFLVVDVSG
jgi:hypothetical protein